MEITYGKRQSGRTHRMLKEAVRLASDGAYVFVVGNSHKDFKLFEFAINAICKELHVRWSGCGATPKLNIGETGGCISFESQASHIFNWDLQRIERCHPSCNVLVDHYAVEHEIERRICRLRELAGKWDESTTADCKADQAIKTIEEVE